MDPELTSRGLGQVGDALMARSLWDRSVPGDLRATYEQWLKSNGGIGFYLPASVNPAEYLFHDFFALAPFPYEDRGE